MERSTKRIRPLAGDRVVSGKRTLELYTRRVRHVPVSYTGAKQSRTI